MGRIRRESGRRNGFKRKMRSGLIKRVRIT
jgi:hypothetical protein